MTEDVSQEKDKKFIIPIDQIRPFYLSDTFLSEYKDKEVNWGFGDLSYFTFKRTYARKKDNGQLEEWWETCQRVVEGVFTVQKAHCHQLNVPWDNRKAQKSAKEMYDRLFSFKWTPPGRGLWMMGTDFVYERGSMPLQNCGFASTKDIDQYFAEPFRWTFEAATQGVGTGFDTRGAGKVTIQQPEISDEVHVIADSREGWGEAFERLLNAYVGDDTLPKEFDYSEIRPKGAPIKSFGGKASGPKPLKNMINSLQDLYNQYIGEKVDSRLIVDTMNIAGKCVVSGGRRRSAQLALGNKDDEQFKDLKLDQEKLEDYRWASNNSIFAEVGMDYSNVSDRTVKNGEPGYIWMDNTRKYGRMVDEPDYKDEEALGYNPCQPKFAKIITENGIREFGDIEIGDRIWSETGWAEVSNKWSTGVKPVYKYKTTAGSFIGTENHRIVTGGEKVEVGSADSIDLLEGPSCEIDDWNEQYVMDGLIVGAGSVHMSSADKVYLTIGSDDQDYFESEVASLIQERHAVNYDAAWKVKTTIKAKELPKTYERQIPERFIKSNARDVCSFLRGLYSANGSICGNRITLKAANFDFIENVQKMLSSVGIRSYYTTNKPSVVEHHNGKYESRQSYDLNITTDRDKFYSQIGFIQRYKNKKVSKIIEQVRPSKRIKNHDIVDVEYLGDFEVFDITVDNEPHTYWSGGFNVSNCAEQPLFDREFCTLVETYPVKHDSFEDFKETLKYAYMYAKTVTLIPTSDKRSNAVMMKNRRIGCSMSGIVQNIEKIGLREHLEWCDDGYQHIRKLDNSYSDWLCTPKSIKVTTVKPSGTVSIVSGVTPGIHYDHSPYYIRRIRIQDTNDMWKKFKKAGYTVEDDVYADDTKVVEFPIKVKYMDRAKGDVSIWEKTNLAVLHQKYWSDNSVSITVDFSSEESDQIENVLQHFEDSLKTISFLPSSDHGYKQAPYEEITEEEYKDMMAKIDTVSMESAQHDQNDKFCSGDACKVDLS